MPNHERKAVELLEKGMAERSDVEWARNLVLQAIAHALLAINENVKPPQTRAAKPKD